ncbi:OmpA/MotB family protein [Orenia marismortui]|uniref:Chemotaxis protein MotB n=1 Tax=Orenia marismortui TaxID=46469 RepID=A0A4R8GZE0_9FIRM|nr:flagellar motor protein MotB [Orenia marismortui]TDX51923.1 chemotaxis protein MotB [Orenia marismortui]
MARQKKSKNDDGGGAGWLATYGDMMTLLLCFFVLLYSFSSIDAEKFRMMMDGLQGKLGVLTGGKTISSAELIESGLDANSPSYRQLSNMQNTISQYIDKQGLQDDIKLEITDRGLTIRFSGKILFDLGRAEIKNNGQGILDNIAGFIKSMPNSIVVEGHTDNWPISNSQFPSNWELSTTRATNVIRYFIEEGNINPARLSAAGYSKYKPIKSNNTKENRAINRRVDVIILRMDQKEGIINE